MVQYWLVIIHYPYMQKNYCVLYFKCHLVEWLRWSKPVKFNFSVNMMSSCPLSVVTSLPAVPDEKKKLRVRISIVKRMLFKHPIMPLKKFLSVCCRNLRWNCFRNQSWKSSIYSPLCCPHSSPSFCTHPSMGLKWRKWVMRPGGTLECWITAAFAVD